MCGPADAGSSGLWQRFVCALPLRPPFRQCCRLRPRRTPPAPARALDPTSALPDQPRTPPPRPSMKVPSPRVQQMPCPPNTSVGAVRFWDLIHWAPGLEGVARTVRAPQSFDICVFPGTVFPRFQAQRHQVKNPPARQRETPGIIQKPLATIHKHLGTPAVVVCGGPIHRVKSPETSERCRTVRTPCNTTLLGTEFMEYRTVQRTLLFRPYFWRTRHGWGGGGGYVALRHLGGPGGSWG